MLSIRPSPVLARLLISENAQYGRASAFPSTDSVEISEEIAIRYQMALVNGGTHERTGLGTGKTEAGPETKDADLEV